MPFWQDEIPAAVTADVITNGSVRLEVPGNIWTVLDVDFKNVSGMAINRFKVSSGGNRVELTGIALGGNETIRIYHGTDGLLRIIAGGMDVYAAYRGSDDLYAYPGIATVSIEAPRAGQLTVRATGRWIG